MMEWWNYGSMKGCDHVLTKYKKKFNNEVIKLQNDLYLLIYNYIDGVME